MRHRSSSRPRRSEERRVRAAASAHSLLALGAVLAASALIAAGCGSSSTKTSTSTPTSESSPATAASTPAAASTTSTTATSAGALSGTWNGQYEGAYSGTFVLNWVQTGSSLKGAIKLSAPAVTLSVNGTLSGSSIQFGTVGSVAITYTGSVSGGSSMSGSYTTPNGGGSWSAHKA